MPANPISPTYIETLHTCYHCGEECRDEVIHSDDHDFCCDGCVLVYDLLKENDLCQEMGFEATGLMSDSAQKLSYFAITRRC